MHVWTGLSPEFDPRGEDFGAEKFLVFDVKARLKNLRVEPL